MLIFYLNLVPFAINTKLLRIISLLINKHKEFLKTIHKYLLITLKFNIY